MRIERFQIGEALSPGNLHHLNFDLSDTLQSEFMNLIGRHIGRSLVSHREPVPRRCVACSSVALARHGAGTERIEHELAAALGEADFPVLRLDADSVGLAARARTLAVSVFSSTRP